MTGEIATSSFSASAALQHQTLNGSGPKKVPLDNARPGCKLYFWALHSFSRAGHDSPKRFAKPPVTTKFAHSHRWSDFRQICTFFKLLQRWWFSSSKGFQHWATLPFLCRKKKLEVVVPQIYKTSVANLKLLPKITRRFRF